MPAATLPSAADRAFEAVGHVPLAVALLAAAVRGRQEWGQETADPGQDTSLGGRSWEEIAADLVRDADVYGTHPYATTFRALHIAVAALPDDLRAALLGLAVFPPDSAVPVAAIARYWAHTRGRSAEETVADLDRLIAAEVLQRGEDTDTIGFHDLAHEYLLLHADALPALHEQLLDAYRGLLEEPDQWWTLPLGRAVRVGAPDRASRRGRRPRHTRRHGNRSGVSGEADRAGRPARRRGGPRCGRAHRTRRCGGRVVAGMARTARSPAWWAPRNGARPARVAATMLAWLEADPSRPAAVRPARLAPLLSRPCLAVHGGLAAEPTRSSAYLQVTASTSTPWAGHLTATASPPPLAGTGPRASGTPPPVRSSPSSSGAPTGSVIWRGLPTVTAWPPPARTGSLTSGTPPPAKFSSSSSDTPRVPGRWPGRPMAPGWPPSAATAPPTSGTPPPARSSPRSPDTPTVCGPGLVARRHPAGHRRLRRHRHI